MNNRQMQGKSAMHIALSYLSRRPLTIGQLSNKLKDKGFSPEEVNDAVVKLIEWKYLDDDQYTETYIKSKRDKLSKQKMMMELLRFGVDKELITRLLGEIYSDDQEYQNCMRIGWKLWKEERSKWERKYKNNPKYKNIPQEYLIRKKVGEKLWMRGFSPAIIKTVIANDCIEENGFEND
jgi:regulatory protein